MQKLSLEGRVAVVTGAGGGLGRSYALDLAAAGASVVVNDTGGSLAGDGPVDAAAQTVVDEIVARGGRAVASVHSVATPEGGEAIIGQALETFGGVDIVVNNAGILRDRSISKLEWDDFHKVHDVHLRGSAYVSQPAFRHMQTQGFGRLIFVGSNAGTFGNFGQAAYGSAKGGAIALSGVFAIEGERHGILSNVVCPIARTRMTDGVLGPELTLSPSDVSPLVLYLASAECTVTHQVFSAGGGRFSRVFTGLTDGWFAGPGQAVSASDVAQHIDEILDTGEFTVPMSASEEVAALAARLREYAS